MGLAANVHQMSVRGLKVFYGQRQAIQAFDLEIRPRQITALIGPSGCGKSTVLRCLNRMLEITPQARVEGEVLLDETNIYAKQIDAALVRRKIGLIFQEPSYLYTRSIYENVAVGLRLGGLRRRAELEARVEQALRAANLWDEVKDRLAQPGGVLSLGQQQRLSIARSIAVEPDILLFDEPCAALDPISTLMIEELLLRLKERYTLVLVTHNMQQAARIANRTAVFMVEREVKSGIPMGVLVEEGPTERIFVAPHDPRTEAYLSGRR